MAEERQRKQISRLSNWIHIRVPDPQFGVVLPGWIPAYLIPRYATQASIRVHTSLPVPWLAPLRTIHRAHSSVFEDF